MTSATGTRRWLLAASCIASHYGRCLLRHNNFT
jgi:hypothetical protein